MNKKHYKPSFIGSINSLGTEYVEEDGGKYIVAALGHTLGLERIGVNHETIFPRTRSSVPHCHSTDEEFVFVVKGRPSLWLDGHIHELVAGDSVAFPAGTGMAHTFLNNSDEPIELLIVGENSSDDKVCYPLHPEVERLHPRPWTDAPAQELGPHNGEVNS
jgi:uncharacterized cupin superfamily protein